MPRKSSKDTKFSAVKTLVVLFALAIGTSILFSVFAHKAVKRDRSEVFHDTVVATKERIKERTDVYVTLLYGARGLFATKKTVSRGEWSNFVKSMDIARSFPGVSVMSVVERVSTTGKQAFLARMRGEGYENFQITPNQQKNEYYVVTYLEPSSGYEKVLGFDFSSEPIRREALEKARDKNIVTATGLIKSQSIGRPAFAMVLPIYQYDKPQVTITERRSAIEGFVLVGFRTMDLFSNIFPKNIRDASVHVEIFDGTVLTDDHLLYDSFAEVKGASTAPPPQITETEALNVAGRTWTLRFTSVEYPNTAQRIPEFGMMVWVGISSLIFLIVYRLIRRNSSR